MPRILVVDDDVVQLDLYAQILEIAGYLVEIALTAAQTVRCIENAPADLVIMDLRIPNALGESDSQEGMALIRRIRDLGYRAPVIVLYDVVQLDLYAQILEIAGYLVEIALTAAQTVRCIENAPADLVIMDLRIPNALGESDSQEG